MNPRWTKHLVLITLPLIWNLINALKTVTVIGSFFTQFIENAGYFWWFAISQKALLKKLFWTELKITLSFLSFVNWKEHLFNIEVELGIEGKINFVIIKTSNGDIRVNTVPAR